jgi:hypothetical protein
MNQFESLERRIGAPANPTDIKDVREELNLKFERLKSRNKSNSNDEEEEHAMFAGGNKSRSKCNHCGKFGHKSADCFSKGKSEKAEEQSGGGGNGQPTAVKAKFTGKFFYRKLAGHRAADCQKKKRDLAAGQPNQGNVAAGGKPKVSFPEEIDLMAYEDDSETEDTPDRFYVTCGVCSQDKEDTMLILGQHRCADCREDQQRLDLFLADVARKKGIQVGHVQSWSQAVRVKLAKIDLRSVSNVTACVPIIKGKLRAAHQKEMHNYSLEVITRGGVRNIEKHYRALLRVFKEDKEQAQQELECYQHAEVTSQHAAVKRVRRPSNDDQDGGTKNDDRKEGDVALVAHTEDSPKKITKNTFLGNTGASTHMGNNDEDMFDVTVISSPIKIGNGVVLMATKIGKRRVTAIQADGTSLDLILEDYKYVPDLWVNLFSITKALSKGWNIGNKGIKLFINKGSATRKFDQVFRTQKGLVLGVKIVPKSQGTAGIATAALKEAKLSRLITSITFWGILLKT